MKYYKNSNNEVFAFEEDGSQDNLIRNNWIKITQDEVRTLLSSKEKESFSALSYSTKRQMEYPPITDYIDGIVKNDQLQIDKYIKACLAVKAKYPKV